jgi:hypothetical protein
VRPENPSLPAAAGVRSKTRLGLFSNLRRAAPSPRPRGFLYLGVQIGLTFVFHAAIEPDAVSWPVVVPSASFRTPENAGEASYAFARRIRVV